VPPALMAATPVGATTAICLPQLFLMYLSKVVLPVPALPVKKIFWLVAVTNCNAWLKDSFISIASVIVGKNKGVCQKRQLCFLKKTNTQINFSLNLLLAASSATKISPKP
jgi:hypothetical protein